MIQTEEEKQVERFRNAIAQNQTDMGNDNLYNKNFLRKTCGIKRSEIAGVTDDRLRIRVLKLKAIDIFHFSKKHSLNTFNNLVGTPLAEDFTNDDY